MKQTAALALFIIVILTAFYFGAGAAGNTPAAPGYPGPCAYPGNSPYPGPCEYSINQPPLEYPKPEFVAQCWFTNDTWSQETFLQFTVVQDMPIVDYLAYWGKYIDHSEIELWMAARLKPFPRKLFDEYIQFHSKAETLPGIYRLKWQGSQRVSSFYTDDPTPEFEVGQAYLKFQSGNYFPCAGPPCIVPFPQNDLGDKIYPIHVDTYNQVDIGECLDRSTLTETVYLPAVEVE